MMKRTSWLLHVVFIVAFVSTSYGPTLAEVERNAGGVCSHKAIIYQDMSSDAEYVKATTTDFAFPESARSFSGSEVFVRKYPDLILNSEDFADIEIVRETTDDPIQQKFKDKGGHIAPGQNFIINFRLTDPAAKKMLEYTQKNIGSYLVIKINRQIFSVAHLMEPLKREISLHLSGINTDGLKTKLISLKKNIIVKD